MGGVEGSGSRNTQGKSWGGATGRSQDIATADGCVGEGEVAVKAKAGGNWVGACAAVAAWWPLGPHASNELHSPLHTAPTHKTPHNTTTAHSALRPSAGPPRHWPRARAVNCARVLLPPANTREHPNRHEDVAMSSGANVKADAKFTRLAASGTAWPVPRAPALTAPTLVNPRPLPLPAPCNTSETHSGRASVWAALAIDSTRPTVRENEQDALPANRLRMPLPFALFRPRPPAGDRLDSFPPEATSWRQHWTALDIASHHLALLCRSSHAEQRG
ncbi:hypothetical protein PMIN02_012148 [Paraphaeosphaeria minitans]